jgi:hypothetical protein
MRFYVSICNEADVELARAFHKHGKFGQSVWDWFPAVPELQWCSPIQRFNHSTLDSVYNTVLTNYGQISSKRNMIELANGKQVSPWRRWLGGQPGQYEVRLEKVVYGSVYRIMIRDLTQDSDWLPFNSYIGEPTELREWFLSEYGDDPSFSFNEELGDYRPMLGKER